MLRYVDTNYFSLSSYGVRWPLRFSAGEERLIRPSVSVSRISSQCYHSDLGSRRSLLTTAVYIIVASASIAAFVFPFL